MKGKSYLLPLGGIASGLQGGLGVSLMLIYWGRDFLVVLAGGILLLFAVYVNARLAYAYGGIRNFLWALKDGR